MSLQLYVGHSGQVLDIDTTRINNLDALRTFVAQNAAIQPNRQVLLTAKGKSVRPQTLLTENELFVFDSSLLSSSTVDISRTATHIDLPALIDTDGPPDTLANQTDLQSWQALFRSRLVWARDLRAQCAAQADLAAQALREQAVVQRSLGVALESLQIHTKGAEQKQRAAAAWAEEMLRDQERKMETLQRDEALLESIPARPDFARFIQYSQRSKAGGVKGGTLKAFMPAEQVGKAAGQVQSTMAFFRKRVAGTKALLGDAKRQNEELTASAEQMQGNSSMEASMEPAKLMEEIDIILRKISSDDNHVSSLPKTSQSVSQASKMALLHTRNYLPNMQEYAAEMNDLVRKAVQQRNNTAETCMHHMQTLSGIESLLAKIYADVKGLDMPQEDQQAFNTLNIVSRLPLAYGSMLVEAVRRREWIEKMKRDSSTLAEEMATYQEEEERRRKRWLNSIDDVIEPELAKSKALGIEVNLQAETDIWPSVDRQEIQDYIQALAKLQFPEQLTQDLSQALRALDQPTRKQVKHAKAFRNGSMHDAAFGSTSLAMRGEDDFKVLRDANTKLEEELRGHKSRVRKLEDLLHRQTALSRAQSGDVFMPQIELVSRPESPSVASRRISEDFRPGSSRSRRTSSNQGIEEKRLARRIVMLEAELQSQREHNAAVEKDAQARQEAHENGRVQIEEANSIKKDIMENMEAQQREFALERRNLEQELGLARAKTEELEDELDRILGSRDNEKSGLDARTRSLAAELQEAKDAAATAAAEKTRNVEEMRQNWLTEQQRSKLLEDQLRDAMTAQEQAEASVKRLQAAAEEQRQVEQDIQTTLAEAHAHLSPSTEVPEKYTTLVAALEDLARRSSAHVKELAEAVDVAKSENESLLAQHQVQTSELQESRKKHSDAEDQLARIREQHSSEAAKAQSLTAQLEDEREQLRNLRTKFADGETGADALRQRAEEQESQVGKLSEQLAEAKSHVNSLDVELMRVQSKLNAARTEADAANGRLESRSARAKELSQRLFAQNARLLRLLESLGFAVSHKDGAMIIERASKVGASTTLSAGDASQLLNRTVSLSSPPATRKHSSAVMTATTSISPPNTNAGKDLSFLHWSDAPSPTAEDTLFTTLTQQLSLFNTDTFADALAKRLRDFEYTARKFRLEARAASGRASKATQDALTKLAVRDFKEGDLALFLPTKGKKVGAWAAFNINAPHHFLRERDGMNLKNREWLVARITKVEERVVDLGRSLRSTGVEADDGSVKDGTGDKDSLLENEDNPFDLSDGLTWFLVHATEERAGAPTTPGLGKTTVQGSMDVARAERRREKAEEGKGGVDQLKEKLGKSLESRRSSSTSKRSGSASVKGVPIPGVASTASPRLDTGRSPGSESVLGKSPLGQGQGGSAGGSYGAQGLGILSEASGTPDRLTTTGNVEGRSDADKTALSIPPPSAAPTEGLDKSPPRALSISSSHRPPSSSLPTQHAQDPFTNPPTNGNTTAIASPTIDAADPDVDRAISSAMDASLRLRTPQKPQQPFLTPRASPDPRQSGRSLAGSESRSMRSLRGNLEAGGAGASPTKGRGSRGGGIRGVPSRSSLRSGNGEGRDGVPSREGDEEGNGERKGYGDGSGVVSPTRGHAKRSSLAGWRSLWSVDYEIEGERR